MTSIKFSHNYPKLWNQKIARLLNVHVTLKENLDKDLIEYDTKNSISFSISSETANMYLQFSTEHSVSPSNLLHDNLYFISSP